MSVPLDSIHADISQLSDDELIERIRALRGRRDNPPAVKAKTKKAKPKSLADKIAAMSPEEKQLLFAKLTGGN